MVISRPVTITTWAHNPINIQFINTSYSYTLAQTFLILQLEYLESDWVWLLYYGMLINELFCVD